jgi:hypothetical protein
VEVMGEKGMGETYGAAYGSHSMTNSIALQATELPTVRLEGFLRSLYGHGGCTILGSKPGKTPQA